MDPVTAIVTALAAGASTGAIGALKDDAAEGTKAAYAKLRGLRADGSPGSHMANSRYSSTKPPRRSGKACSPPN